MNPKPVLDLLWRPMGGSANMDRCELWTKSHSISFHGFSSWQIPASPTWQEDPFDNDTWKLWYHCLTWLYIPDKLFEETGDQKYLSEIRSYAMQWMREHESSYMLTSGDMAWDDHAIAYRSTLLIYLNLKYFQLDTEWTAIFNNSVDLHGRALHGFLLLPQFRGNNHGVFHCFALLNMVAALPKLDVPSYKADAHARLFELLGEMINWRDGVTREQALEYQYIALELVNEVVELSDFFGLSSTAERFTELRTLLSRSGVFSYLR